MITEEDFNNAIETIKGKLDDTNSALISDDLLSMKAGFDGALSSNKEKDATIEKLNNEKDELIKVNGKLFQKIGYPDTSKKEDEETDDKISLNDIINEKGELI